MYNHNLDGWMFEAMKDYNHQQEAAQRGKAKRLAGKLLTGLGGALTSAGSKLKQPEQPSLTWQTKEG